MTAGDEPIQILVQLRYSQGDFRQMMDQAL
jgi:hypothetical protein